MFGSVTWKNEVGTHKGAVVGVVRWGAQAVVGCGYGRRRAIAGINTPSKATATSHSRQVPVLVIPSSHKIRNFRIPHRGGSCLLKTIDEICLRFVQAAGPDGTPVVKIWGRSALMSAVLAFTIISNSHTWVPLSSAPRRINRPTSRLRRSDDRAEPTNFGSIESGGHLGYTKAQPGQGRTYCCSKKRRQRQTRQRRLPPHLNRTFAERQ